MKKSNMSRKGSCFSLLTSGLKDQPALELMRISLKKETQRRQKLQKLLGRYQSIRLQQKSHIKSIKASIIQLKDSISVAKIHYLVDPNIYVDNNLSIQTRQFLCMLLNTFYKRYQQNKQYEQTTKKMTQNVKVLLKQIQNKEELLFKKQKSTINQQVQLQGQFLSQKNKLKEYNIKNKELENENNRVKAIWDIKKALFEEQSQKVNELRLIQSEIQSKITGLDKKINEGEQIKQGNKEKISGQMAYHSKVQEEISILKQCITKEMKRQTMLKQKIMQKSLKNNKLKGLINIDNNRHEVDLKILQIQKPRLSTKVHGVSTILQIQRSFAKNMSQVWNEKQNISKIHLI